MKRGHPRFEFRVSSYELRVTGFESVELRVTSFGVTSFESERLDTRHCILDTEYYTVLAVFGRV